MARHRLLVSSLAACGSLVLAGACFPDFEVTVQGGPDSGVDGASSADATTTDAGDATPPAKDANADGATTNDSASSVDANVPQVLIPSGSFAYRNPSDSTSTQATLTHAFYLDTTEVTVGVFTAWVNAGKPTPCTGAPCSLDPGGPYATTITWDPAWNTYTTDELYKSDIGCHGVSQPFDEQTGTYQFPGVTNPITCLNWYQAASVCWFAGNKRLPTQVEWQYEATGRGIGRTYPWGDTPAPSDCTHAIWNDGDTSTYNGCKFPISIGSAPAGASMGGVNDMVGSVHEWVWDWYDSSYPTSWGSDYAGLAADAGFLEKVVRGGGWASDISDMASLHIYVVNNSAKGTPTLGFNDVGVRCARTKL